MSYPPRYKLYPGGEVVEVQEPIRVPGPVPHTVKFRHADTEKTCSSELCPVEDNRIEEGDKYARVQRIGRRRKAVTELFHPKCYDDEFDQGHG